MTTQTITGTTSTSTATTPAFTEYRMVRARRARFTGWVARLRGRRSEAMWQWQPVATAPIDTRTELLRAQSRLLAAR